MTVTVRYTKDAQTRLLEVPGDVWAIVERARCHMFPDVTPDKREPAYLRAMEINRGEK